MVWAVWYYSYKLQDGELTGKRITVFLDERLKTEEEKDYLLRMEDSTSENSEIPKKTKTIMEKINIPIT